jgi:hypothetical protein
MKHLLVFFSLAFFQNHSHKIFISKLPKRNIGLTVFLKPSQRRTYCALMVVRLSAKTPDGIVFYDKQVEKISGNIT